MRRCAAMWDDGMSRAGLTWCLAVVGRTRQGLRQPEGRMARLAGGQLRVDGRANLDRERVCPTAERENVVCKSPLPPSLPSVENEESGGDVKTSVD